MMSQFSLFLSSFSGVQRILGYVRPRGFLAQHPPETEKEGASGGASDWDSLRAALSRNWPLNAPLEDADPEFCHSV